MEANGGSKALIIAVIHEKVNFEQHILIRTQFDNIFEMCTRCELFHISPFPRGGSNFSAA